MQKDIFKKKNALVIGGTSSIGYEVVKKLSDCGCHVTAVGRHIPENPVDADYYLYDFDNDSLDIFNRPDFCGLMESCDILVNCYGPFVYKQVHETSVDEWIKTGIMDYALSGALVSGVLPGMMNRNWGRIILFGGTRTDSVKGYRNNCAYAGAKTGVSVIVKSVSQEYKKYGISCNGIYPGFTRNAPAENMLINAIDIAEKVVYLMENDELNGVLLNIDRGWVPYYN